MSRANLSEELRRFIRACVPTTNAAELLLFLFNHGSQPWTVDDIAREMHPGVIKAPAISEYLTLFQSRGLVVQHADARFQYRPSSPELERAVAELAAAYNERPVTLIRYIYDQASDTIQSFADAFKLKKDD